MDRLMTYIWTAPPVGERILPDHPTPLYVSPRAKELMVAADTRLAFPPFLSDGRRPDWWHGERWPDVDFHVIGGFDDNLKNTTVPYATPISCLPDAQIHVVHIRPGPTYFLPKIDVNVNDFPEEAVVQCIIRAIEWDEDPQQCPSCKAVAYDE